MKKGFTLSLRAVFWIIVFSIVLFILLYSLFYIKELSATVLGKGENMIKVFPG